MKLRSLHRYSYNNTTIDPGDVFEASDDDGALMVAMGGAERADDDVKVGPAPPPKKTRKRGYLRRDERAQD